MIELTPSEWAIVEHRLTLDDCLADCICDTFELYADGDWERIRQMASDLYTQVKKTKQIDFDKLDKMQIEIITDCLEGSTYFGSIEDALASGEINKGQYMSMFKAAQSLERKFASAGHKTLVTLY